MLRSTFAPLLLPNVATGGDLAQIGTKRDTLGVEACKCSESGLTNGPGQEDAALCARGSKQYVQNGDQDQSTADAWGAPVRVEAQRTGSDFIPLLERTSDMRRIHREVVVSCR